MTTTETVNADVLLEMESVNVMPFSEHDKIILRSYEPLLMASQVLLVRFVKSFCTR